MYRQSLLAMALGVVFCLGSSAIGHAQSCQNQTCQVNSQGCYTCVNSTGSFCNLSGSCPQSCSEGSCNPPSPCELNPVGAGCVNPCINDPNAPEGCGREIICDGNTITSCDGSGSGNPSGPGNPPCRQITGCPDSLKDLSIQKTISALLPRKPATSCQTASLPKQLLFSI